MKRNPSKKVIALMLTFVMLLVPVMGFTAYAEEPFRLSITAPEGTHEHDDRPVRQELKRMIAEHTNTEIEWIWYGDGNAYWDQIPLMFAVDNIPTIMVIGPRDPNFILAIDGGGFWDLTDYIDDFPNLTYIHPVARETASLNGRLWGIPRSRAVGRNGFGIRYDWLQNLGLNIPETVDELREVLWQFTYMDPDGNGLDDTYGLAVTSWLGTFDIMQVWFGVPNGWGFDEDGQLLPAHMFPEYMDALRWFRGLYADGLMTPNFHEVDPATWDEILRGGFAGAVADVVDRTRRNYEFMYNEMGLSGTWTLLPYMDAGFGPRTHPTAGFNNVLAISRSGAPTHDDMLRALRFLDQMNDPEMWTIADFGLYGVDWGFDENEYAFVFTDDEKEALGHERGSNRLGFNQIVPYYSSPANIAARPPVRPPHNEIRILEADIQLYIEQFAIPNPAASFLSATQAAHGPELDALLNTIRSEFIRGVIDETQVHELIQQWLRIGGEQVIEEMNEIWRAAQSE